MQTNFHYRTLLLVGLAIASFQSRASSATANAPVQFTRDIRPILSDKCFACHGPDRRSEVSELTDLRLDDRESATSADAIVPGDSGASELLARIVSTDPDLLMPPADSHKAKLTEAEVALIRRWIDQGAAYEKLWSLVPPRRTELPAVRQKSWAQAPWDHFVLARLEAEGFEPSPIADRRTLLRRVTFDLTGLPPTPSEIQAFVDDPTDTQQALEKVVERLLASPAYGEHMAAEWLQLARFADSNGYQNDFRREMWIWRDWVIDAFNSNMPYDQFALEQMAGDLIPSPTQSQLIATGFHRNNRTVTENGSVDEEWRVENNIDRVETTATAFLGLTMGCARCHDHKYDAISQEEFYQFYAFFNSIDEKGVYVEQRGNVPPLLKVPTPEQQARLAELDTRIEQAREKIAKVAGSQSKTLIDWAKESLDHGASTPVVWSLPLNGSLEPLVASEDLPPLCVTYRGGTPEWDDSITGEALKFSGEPDSHLEFSQHNSPGRDTPFASAIWIRHDGGEGAILSQMNDAERYRGWDLIVLPNQRVKFHLIHHWNDDAIAVISRATIPEGEWSHVAVSYDGSGRAAGVRIFVNGKPSELEVEQDCLEGTTVSDQPLRVGRRSSGLYFKGAMASLHWCPQALDEGGVASLTAHDLARAEGLEIKQWPKGRQELLQRFAARDQPGGATPEHAELAKLEGERKKVDDELATVMILRDRATPRPTYVLERGVYDAPDESKALSPDVPAMLPPLPKDAPRDRLALANWLVDRSHPLFARVQVNRVWQRLFGRGIVATPDNFGVQGDSPSHPELLDWLAVEFVESGWDLKALQKQIVLSATYQQSSNASPTAYEQDPNNIHLARGARFRLPAEMLRDNALAVSGLLTHKVGGPSVKPYQPEGLWDELAGGAGEGPYVLSEGADLFRRSLYTNRKRTVPQPTLSTFDAPSFEICQAGRMATNTPLQALALLNDKTYVAAARAFAVRLLNEAVDEPGARIRYGFELATGRQPDDQELAVLRAALDRHLAHYREQRQDAELLQAVADLNSSNSHDPSEVAAYTIIASVILNLDETITHQ
ncbi:DUF1553 domain-containing protein [Aeoliella sp. SH292]|uniref:DUF1553 domain-containing protein n=1 Tax=Aeoliella sp. SH292 TaxID=3454464 RepID=UPI003F980502